MKVQHNAYVAVEYSLALDDGEMVEQSDPGESLGFVVGAPLAMGMRAAMKGANLSVALSPELYAVTGAITIVMCSLAALLSIVKVLRLDPASVFKA